MNTSRSIITVLIASLVTACASMQEHERELAISDAEMSAFLADKPPELTAQYRALKLQGKRNAVLNHMRLGLANLELGDSRRASESLDFALNEIETIYADNPEAKKARSNFVKENAKTFKGEPYERAMAYYYRGILYLQENDYENARASFKSAMLQDGMAETEDYRQDFSAMAFLDGWASHCNGNAGLAEDQFGLFTELGVTPVAVPGTDHDVVLLAELGNAPIKQAQGEHSEELVFARPGAVAERKVRVTFLDQEIPVGESIEMEYGEDIYWQASTRGGRQVDKILQSKAQFKENTEVAGDVMQATGVALTASSIANDNYDMGVLGLAFQLGGLISSGVSAATRTEADARYWDNLPEHVLFATASIPPGATHVQFEYLTGWGSVAEDKTTISALGNSGSCEVAWSRSESALDIPARAPNSSSKSKEV